MRDNRSIWKWCKRLGIVATVVLLIAWDASTQYWFATEIGGVRFQLYDGKFVLGWGFNGSLGSWVRTTGNPFRSASHVFGLILPQKSYSPFGFTFFELPLWILVVGAAGSAWLGTRFAEPKSRKRLPSALLRTWRQKVAVTALVLVLPAWWISARSVALSPAIVTSGCEYRIGLGDGRVLFGAIDVIHNLHALKATLARAGFHSTLPNPRATAVKSLGPFLVPGRSVPLWIVALCIGAAAVFMLWPNRRPPRGHCTTCGYSLTGNVSGVCPECGRAVDAPIPSSRTE